jgi:capsular polysaccharide transport system permease protein
VLQKVLSPVRRVNALFLLIVLLPVTLATAYFGFIASDIYVSESRFVVRSQQRQASPGVLGSLLETAGMSRAQDEAYSVHDFILSRDALQNLDKQLRVREAFSAESIDILSRFPGLDWDDSFESLYEYYPRRVTVAYDSTSSIMTLKVSAFTPDDAVRINEHLLAMSERLVNQLNKRAHEDSIRFASGVVQEAEVKAKSAALALSAFRTDRSVFDPERQSAIQLQGIAKLQEELISTKTQLEQVRRLTADNPQVAVLTARVATLQKEIDSEMRKVAGGGSSLTTKASEYERLALERAFAEKQLASALASLELARNEAQRKQLYLERIVQPNRPDYAIEPRRVRSILMVLVFGLIAWGALSLLISAIREHHD